MQLLFFAIAVAVDSLVSGVSKKELFASLQAANRSNGIEKCSCPGLALDGNKRGVNM